MQPMHPVVAYTILVVLNLGSLALLCFLAPRMRVWKDWQVDAVGLGWIVFVLFVSYCAICGCPLPTRVLPYCIVFVVIGIGLLSVLVRPKALSDSS